MVTRYLTLDDANVRAAATEDPQAFLEHETGLVNVIVNPPLTDAIDRAIRGGYPEAVSREWRALQGLKTRAPDRTKSPSLRVTTARP